MELKTGKLILRDFRFDDLPAYLLLRNDSKFQRFYSEEESGDGKSESLLRLFVEQANETPRTKFQLAICSNDQVLMGSCGIRMEGAGSYSIGCELGRRWHSSGIAKKACTAIIEFGFRELNAERIYAETISENLAAIRLCASIGLKMETERINDRFFKGRSWNTAVYTIMRNEWLI